MVNTRYRADIDGLRAIAVLSVLAFHFGVDAFSGGFVGVDVFFVISGFLITRLIKDELASGSFTFSHFYLRRARRLFPALFTTLILSFAGAYQLFSSPHFERFGGTLLYTLLSISNVFFWNEQGYFDTNTVFKPLLHTWSLSVEEQFYLIWPATLTLILSVKQRGFASFAIISLGLISLYCAQTYLATDANAVFYLSPFRIVEFACGAITVWFIKKPLKNGWLLECILLGGLLMIGYAIFAFKKDTIFPGINALIPCIGSALVIYAGQARYTGKLLSNSVMVRIGLISYSVYLIHWPLFVFYQYPVSHPLGNFEILGLFISTLLLATLMYHWVETPFRQLRFAKRQFSAIGCGLACALFALAASLPAAHVWKYDGWPWRLQNPQRAINQPDYTSEMDKRFVYIRTNYDCLIKLHASCTSDQTIDGLVIGDSHAVDGFNVLTIASKNKHRLSLLSLSGCNPVLKPEIQIPPVWPDRNKCIALQKRWFNPHTYANYDYLVVSSLLGDYFLAAELKQYLQFIKSQTHIKHVIVFGNYIVLKQDLHSLIENDKELHDNIQLNLKSAFLENEQLKQVCAEMGCLFIDKKQLLCKNQELASCRIELEGIPFTWDEHHLSLEYSSWLGVLARKRINKYLNQTLL